MEENCYICDWVSRIDGNEKNYFIAELETGYVFLSSKWQYFLGYTFFISKICVSELHHMPVDFRSKFLFEMTIVSEAVQKAFNPVKMNCESLGNSCAHVHWHIIPRHGTDPNPDKSIWTIERETIESVTLTEDELMEMRNSLVAQMKDLAVKNNLNASFQ